MPYRELTEEEQGRLLTADEVALLPEGTKVWIKWEGGNGPHLYTIGANGWIDNMDANRDDVGLTKHHTRVFLATAEEADTLEASPWTHRHPWATPGL